MSCKIVKSYFLRKLGCKSALAVLGGRTDNCVGDWPSSCIGQRKRDEGGNRKGNGPVVFIPLLLIDLDRCHCFKTTNDLYMQQWHGDHYITSQITEGITTQRNGCEPVTAAS